MPGNSAILTIKIIADASKASAEMDRAASRMGKAGDFARKAAIPAAALGTALLIGAKKAVDAASRTEQAMGGVDAVFGKNAATVKRWAAGAADSIGLSKSQYGELATVIGSQLKNAGLSMDQVTKKTGGLISMGGDLAAMYGGTTSEAVEALSSALKGEFDPMEKYGASLSATAIKAQMVADGTDKLTGKQAQAAKTQATLALITEQTADAHGAAAREYDSAAASQQRLSAKTENLMASMGVILLPIVVKLADAFAKVATWATKNTTAFQIMVGAVAGIVVGILALNAAMSAYNTISSAAAIVQKVLRGSIMATRIQLLLMSAAQKITAVTAKVLRLAWATMLGPVGLIILAIVALIAVFVLLYKRSTTFRNFVNKMWAGIKSAASSAGNAIKTVWRAVFAAASAYVRAYVSVAKAVFNALRSAVGFVIDKVRSLVSWFRNLKVPPAIRTAINAVRDAAGNAIGKVKDLVSKLGNLHVPGVVLSAINAIKGAIDSVIGRVSDLIGWLSRIKVPKINLPGGKSAPKSSSFAASTGVGPSRFRASGMTRASSTSSTTAPIVINVSGALDPDAVARQIRRIMDGHDRRVGRRVVTAL